MRAPSLQPSTTTERGGALRLAALLFAAGLPALAQAAPPLTVSTTGSLGFGRFAAAGGGSITVAPNGLRTRSGGVALLSSPAGTAASFAILGRNPNNFNNIIIVSLPPNGSETLNDGPARMAVNDFVSDLPPGGVLNSTNNVIRVGATLSVAPSQKPGNYTGKFQITVEYQ